MFPLWVRLLLPQTCLSRKHLLQVLKRQPGKNPMPLPYTGLMETTPLCPTCGQPGTRAFGPDEEWECRNEACPEYGQVLRADEPEVSEDSSFAWDVFAPFGEVAQ